MLAQEEMNRLGLRAERHSACGQWVSVSDYYIRQLTGVDRASDFDLPVFNVTASVEARWKGETKYFPGVISRVNPSGTYDIKYDERGEEMGVDPR